MDMLHVIKKPNKCPRCAGNVYKILYGMPACPEEEYYKRYGEHVVYGGCIMREDNPEYACCDCGLQFKELSFPSNANAIAKEALIKEDLESPYKGVRFCCIYRKQMVFEPVYKPWINYDGFVWIFVNQLGKAKVYCGTAALDLNPKIYKTIHQFDEHDEKIYRIAAWRLIKEEGEDCYYENVRKCRFYKGKRVFRPILKEEYKSCPMGLPLVILVDRKGHAEYVRDELSFCIYEELRKNKKINN